MASVTILEEQLVILENFKPNMGDDERACLNAVIRYCQAWKGTISDEVKHTKTSKNNR